MTIKRFALASLSLIAIPVAALAQSEPPAPPAAAPAPAAAISTTTTPIGELLDNPAAKEILERHLPGFSAHPQIDMARGFTLKAVQRFQPDMLTDELLAKIDADFAALTAGGAK